MGNRLYLEGKGFCQTGKTAAVSRGDFRQYPSSVCLIDVPDIPDEDFEVQWDLVLSQSLEGFDDDKNDNRDHQDRRNFISDPVKDFRLIVFVVSKPFAPFHHEDMRNRKQKDHCQFGMNPRLIPGIQAVKHP